MNLKHITLSKKKPDTNRHVYRNRNRKINTCLCLGDWVRGREHKEWGLIANTFKVSF